MSGEGKVWLRLCVFDSYESNEIIDMARERES